MALTLNRPWWNIPTAHRLIIFDICAELFETHTSASKDIERTRKQTDERTDNAKNNMSPNIMGWGIISMKNTENLLNFNIIVISKFMETILTDQWYWYWYLYSKDFWT